MHLYQYKQNIWQCKILLAHTVPIQTLETVPPSLASSAKPTVFSILCSGQVPSQDTREMGQPLTAKWDAA